jgi:RNA polymerase sigma-70 factor (ECF subfamily)
MNEQGDDELIQQSLGGNRDAFGILVERYQKAVFNITLRLLHDEADAEDAAQSAFVRAYQGLRTFDQDQKFFSWLYRIAVNESINLSKQRNRFERFEGGKGEEVPDKEAEEQEARTEQEGKEQRILDSLMELRVDQRAVIILKHFQGLTYMEIGEILEIPEKTVKSRLFTARTILKNVLVKKGMGKHD